LLRGFEPSGGCMYSESVASCHHEVPLLRRLPVLPAVALKKR
jgi:hypothetical protein